MKNTDVDTFLLVIALLRFLDNCNIYFGRFLRILVSREERKFRRRVFNKTVNRDLIKRRIAWQLLINSPVRDFRWSLIRSSFLLLEHWQASPAVCTDNTRYSTIIANNVVWKLFYSRSINPCYWQITSEYKIKSTDSIIVA